MSSIDAMRIELEALGHAITDKLLAVPIYQRSYAWQEAHVKDFLQDVTNAMVEGEEEYFLGSIVATVGDAGVRLEIVDGQQRLATATILLAAIRDYFFSGGDKNRAADGITHAPREQRAERAQAFEANPRADLGDGKIAGDEHRLRAFEPQVRQISMRRAAELAARSGARRRIARGRSAPRARPA